MSIEVFYTAVFENAPEGYEEVLAKHCKGETNGRDCVFDFEKIIPIPDDVKKADSDKLWDWCAENWGSGDKANCGGHLLRDEDDNSNLMMQWTSPCSLPIEVLKKLSAILGRSIHVRWEGEYPGSYIGRADFENGEMTNIEEPDDGDDAMDMMEEEIPGYKNSYFKNTRGEWDCRNEDYFELDDDGNWVLMSDYEDDFYEDDDGVLWQQGESNSDEDEEEEEEE